jgi:Fe2+ transport system protein B
MYHQSAQIHDQVLQHSHQRGALSRSDKIDRFLTHRFLAIPIFLLVMLTVFRSRSARRWAAV